MLEFILLGKSLKSYTLSKFPFCGFLENLGLISLFLFASTNEDMILLAFIESFLDASLISFCFLLG